ncbi:MAG: polysaccharide deacetylase family protein [Candidatus Peregrinibacteria bacterium]|nr:polysaccharide deacetylase family protein [Candidatus Peregrinibacteria bacterium]
MQNKFHLTKTDIAIFSLATLVIIIGIIFCITPTAYTKASVTQLPESADPVPPTIAPTPATSDNFYAPILMYHHISDTLPMGPYVIRTAVFDNQMNWLKNNNYHVIPYSQFYEALTTKTTLPEKPVVLTFDDNDKDQYENALPILKKYDYKAIFFIPTAYVNKRGGVMTWDMLKELLNEGMEIGAHSSTHPDLRVIPRKQLYDEELIGSKKILEEKLGISIKYFAYPGGAKSKKVVQAVKDTGFLSAVTTIYDPNHTYKDNPLLISRIYVGNSMENFVDFINGRNLYKSH